MLNKLKETQKNPVFLDDDEDDIDNMDFPLPTGGPSSAAAPGMPNMNDIQNMMKSLQGGAGGPAFPQGGFPQASAGPSRASATAQSNNIAVAHTPQGIQRLDPSVYKK